MLYKEERAFKAEWSGFNA